MANLVVDVAGVAFKNPIIPASGVSDTAENMSSCFRCPSWAALQQKEPQDSRVQAIRLPVLQKRPAA